MTAPKAPPSPPSDFDRRPPRPQGDQKPEAILSAIGVLLTAWETLDAELGDLFDGLTPTPPATRIEVVQCYGTIIVAP
jgi:hypothetical protein